MAHSSITVPGADRAIIEVLDGIIRYGRSTAPNVMEAKRLRLVIASWQAIPPSRDVRIAMVARVSELVESPDA